MPIPFIRMVKSKLLAQFPVERLPHPVVSSLILLYLLLLLLFYHPDTPFLNKGVFYFFHNHSCAPGIDLVLIVETKRIKFRCLHLHENIR